MKIHRTGVILAPLLACALLCSCSRRGAEGTSAQTAAEAVSDDSAAADENEKISGADISDDDIVQLTDPELERVGDFINQDSSYGFLLSFYSDVKDADLNNVFDSGIGIAEEAGEDEKSEYLQAVGKDSIDGKLVKISEDSLSRILKQRTGLSYSDFTSQPGWTYLESTKSYYFIQNEEARPYFEVLDGYETDGKLVVHCREDSYMDVSRMYSMEGNTQTPAEAASTAETASTAATSTEVAAQEEPDTSESGWHRNVYEVVLTRTSPFTPQTAQTADTAQSAATSETAAPAVESAQTEEYDFRPDDYGNAYLFDSNALYVQSGMLAQYSGNFTLNPLGQASFVSYGTDSDSPAHADATFEIIRGGNVLQVLPGMTDGNVRDGMTFSRISSVDIEDFDGDGNTDIAVICTYKKDSGGSSAEARLYRGQDDGKFALDSDATEQVNKNVENLTFTSVSAYLRGKSDGKTKTYSSWKEAYADQLSMLDAQDWEGAELIYVNEDRTPELLICGKSQEKGVTLMSYNDGTVQDLHVLRRGVSWLESENVLLDSSSFMDRHYDVVYSVSGDQGLTATTSGRYGSYYGAVPVKNADGSAEYDYDWDGADLSRDGYQEAMMFSFDYYREKNISTKDLTPVGELIEE